MLPLPSGLLSQHLLTASLEALAPLSSRTPGPGLPPRQLCSVCLLKHHQPPERAPENHPVRPTRHPTSPHPCRGGALLLQRNLLHGPKDMQTSSCFVSFPSRSRNKPLPFSSFQMGTDSQYDVTEYSLSFTCTRLCSDHPRFTSQNAVGGALSGHLCPSYPQWAGLGELLGARGLSNPCALSAPPGHSWLSALPQLCPAPGTRPEARKKHNVRD